MIWPGILANHFIDLHRQVPAEEVDQHFKAIVDNNTVGGKLVAMPWYTDAGVLYYRKDLLGEARQAAAADLAGADRDRQGDAGQGARRRQRQDVGLRLPGQGL